MHPSYLGFQIDWPVFVKVSFKTGKYNWQPRDHFNWAELGVDPDKVANLYKAGYLYHSEELQKENEVGYRLHEFNKAELRRVVELVNHKVKERTDSKEQYAKIRCRHSTNMEKQRTLIRRFLYNNPSFEEDYYEVFDYIVSSRSKPIEVDKEECPSPTTTQTSQQELTQEDSMSSDS